MVKCSLKLSPLSTAAHAAGQLNGNIVHIVITPVAVSSRILEPHLDRTQREGPRKRMNRLVQVPVCAAVQEGITVNSLYGKNDFTFGKLPQIHNHTAGNVVTNESLRSRRYQVNTARDSSASIRPELFVRGMRSIGMRQDHHTNVLGAAGKDHSSHVIREDDVVCFC